MGIRFIYHVWNFKSAFFGKDNNLKSGSKGDYIYRDYDNEVMS